MSPAKISEHEPTAVRRENTETSQKPSLFEIWTIRGMYRSLGGAQHRAYHRGIARGRGAYSIPTLLARGSSFLQRDEVAGPGACVCHYGVLLLAAWPIGCIVVISQVLFQHRTCPRALSGTPTRHAIWVVERSRRCNGCAHQRGQAPAPQVR